MTFELTSGRAVFDKASSNLSKGLCFVVDPDVGTLDDLDGETRRLVENNTANKKIGFDETTTMVEVAFMKTSEDGYPFVGEKTYTYPKTRLIGIHRNPESPFPAATPHAEIQSSVISALDESIESVEEITEDAFVELCLEAGLQGLAIIAGTDLELDSEP